ncbi:MAG: FG-GAP-like repeat-containing protein [Candidatus Dormiibacterota bacterium]
MPALHGSTGQKVLRGGVLATLLAAILFAGVPPVAVMAAGPTTIATSSAPKAFQHSAEDKVAYLHDGSLLVGYYDNSNHAIVDHITTPSTTPVSTQVDSITGGSEISFYTLPSTNSTEIWIATGSELTGGVLQEQVQYGVYNGSTFSWHTVATVPGSLTSGRQDPTVTWTGKWLITSWWDDTLGGNTDTVFYNWTTIKDGSSGWHVPAKSGTTAAAGATKSGTTAAATLATATTITYTVTSGADPALNDVIEFGHGTVNSEVRTVTGIAGGPTPAPWTLTVAPLSNPHAIGENDVTAASGAGATSITYSSVVGIAPVAGDSFQIGTAISNNGTVNCSNPPPLTYPQCDADFATVTGVSGSGPYTLTLSSPLVNGHAVGEPIRIGALQLTSTASNSVQVSIRHSAKLGATIAVYGAACQVLTRTLLDSATDPTPGNWNTETAVDPGSNDCEGNFGGPQIAIDESTGNIHVFEAVTTSNSSTWSGVTYWLGTPDGAPMISGIVSWSSHVIVDATGTNATDPPDVAGTVDPATGRVYVFWATHGSLDGTAGGAIKYSTLDGPSYTTASTPVTLSSGSNNHYPHVPAMLLGTGGLAAGYVPLVYQSGSNIVLDNSIRIDNAAPTVPAGLAASTTKKPSVVLTWNASTDDIAVTGYTVYRGGTMIATVGGSTLTYEDTSVVNLSTYTYTVDAFDAAGKHSAQSAPISALIGDTTPPSVPTGLTATSGATANLTLTWLASTDNVGVTGYTVYRNGVPLNTTSGSTLSYVDTTVSGNTSYTYTVDAFDAAGNHSAQSAAAVITTPSFACSTGYSGKLLAGDFTGDHKVDQVLITSVGQCVLVSSGSSYAAPSTWSTSPFYGTTATLVGDVTGDGKADLVAVNSAQTFVSTSNGASFQAPSAWSNVPFYGTRGTYLADVNGDGKADLVAINNTSVWVMLSTGSGFGSPMQWSNTAFYGNVITTVGDVSGDGKADLIAVNNSSIWVMTSTGTGFSAPGMWSSVPFYGNLTTMVADASGDGKAAMIAVNKNAGGQDDFWVAVSTGGAFSAPAFWL